MNFVTFFRRDEIDLVDKHHIRKIDLVRKQVHDRTLIFFPNCLPPIREPLGCRVIAEEVGRIHHRHHRVNLSNIPE